MMTLLNEVDTKEKGAVALVDKSEWDFPSIHELLGYYNDSFFYGKLCSVEVLWSKKMTLCAGLCVYQKGGYCSIRLSEPLLKYREVKEMKETLLHEMIHAYLFLTNNNRDRSDHGPEFRKHMGRINSLTGLNITIYHSFNNEVNHYRKHIWRCNGICQNLPPFYGYVRRAINRAPGPQDPWWQAHKQACSGQYIKISEPDPKPRKSTKEKKESQPSKNTLKLLNLESKQTKLVIKQGIGAIQTSKQFNKNHKLTDNYTKLPDHKIIPYENNIKTSINNITRYFEKHTDKKAPEAFDTFDKSGAGDSFYVDLVSPEEF